jgi:hypothetical protein
MNFRFFVRLGRTQNDMLSGFFRYNTYPNQSSPFARLGVS